MSSASAWDQRHRRRLTLALQRVRRFLRALHNGTLAGDPLSGSLVMYVTEDGDRLDLTGDQANRYRACLDALVNAAPAIAPVSRATVTQALRRAIEMALDPTGSQPAVVFEDLLRRVITELRQAVLEPERWLVHLPVMDVSPDGLPVTVGLVTFRLASGVIDDLDAQGLPSAVNRPIRESLVRPQTGRLDLPSGETGPIVVASVEVIAPDNGSARATARARLRQAVDVINFYGDWYFQSRPVGLRLPGDPYPAVLRISSWRADTTREASAATEHVNPRLPLPLAELVLSDPARTGFGSVSHLLTLPQPNEIESRLLAALQFAGRATLDPRPEEAFVLFTTALEALIIPPNGTGNVTMRLCWRVAAMLSNTQDRRWAFARRMRYLYAVRSRIVHDGIYQVAENDLRLLRFMAKNCIMKMLVEQPFRSMRASNDLESWFGAWLPARLPDIRRPRLP